MLIDLQRVLQRALSSDAPLQVLREAAAGLSREDQAALARVNPEGLVLSSLLVRKLRFERICRGDAAMEAWFEREPARFTQLFRGYNREIPPRAFFPRQEAAAFRAYLESQGLSMEFQT